MHTIYISHSKKFDFKTQLYIPLRTSPLNTQYHIILPHEYSNEPFVSKKFLRNVSAVIAEVSFPATGQGLELGWADMLEIPIACMYRKGTVPSGSLKTISHHLYAYDGPNDMVEKIAEIVPHLCLPLCITCGGTALSPNEIYIPNEGADLCRARMHHPLPHPDRR